MTEVQDAPVTEDLDIDVDTDIEVPQGSITFKIGGQVFRSKRYFPPSFFLLDAEKFSGTDYFIAVAKQVICKEDRARFEALINDPDADITDDKIFQLSMKLLEKISGRPIGRPTSSGDGPDQTSDGSEGNSSSPEGTPPG